MSNPLAIAAVTATLRNLLVRGVGIQDVTARPLDNARRSLTGNQLNLFLYQVLPDAAWRNRDMPRQARPGETGHPPLPLVLYYLLTAYSDDEDDTNAHQLLGQAMSVLHDHPLLGAKEIKDATGQVTGSDLHEQIERVRITLQPLTFEEMSKLWTTFQTHYRVSAAYQISVVLIESTRPPKTPLPVLQRGENDTGVVSQPDIVAPFPALFSLRLPERRLGAQPGDVIMLLGSRLGGGAARLSSARFASPPQPTTAVVNDARLDATLPNNLAAGFYTVAVRLTTPKGEIASNELPLAVAPAITTPLPLTVARASGEAKINLTCGVQVLPEQRVSLLLGDFEVLAEPHAAATNSFQFIIRTPVGDQFPVPTGVGLLARLRVDGVDSEIIAPGQPGEPENAPIKFDENKKITIN
ncbi:MAG TPA: DUF4255 domain-containing protein [Blastocatellia bacterium]|nr:DUF4255 domain-containing protein [Blastocatellia bacterium]